MAEGFLCTKNVAMTLLGLRCGQSSTCPVLRESNYGSEIAGTALMFIIWILEIVFFPQDLSPCWITRGREEKTS